VEEGRLTHDQENDGTNPSPTALLQAHAEAYIARPGMADDDNHGGRPVGFDTAQVPGIHHP